jgi:hypothetical protein
MANEQPTVDERNANLDKLEQATNDWATAEQKRLEDEVAFLRKVQKGRGAEDATTANLAQVTELVQLEIDQFLIGT